MPSAKKGATHTLYYLLIFIVSTALAVSALDYFASGKGGEALKNLENLKILGMVEEKCATLDLPGVDDREQGQTNTYYEPGGIPVQSVAEIYALALYMWPAGVAGNTLSGSWDIKEWKVTCEGKGGKTYTIAYWPYWDVEPEGFKSIPFDKITKKTLIDMSAPDYDAAWQCTNAIKVTLVTADTSGAGTNENVALCYYVNKKKM